MQKRITNILVICFAIWLASCASGTKQTPSQPRPLESLPANTVASVEPTALPVATSSASTVPAPTPKTVSIPTLEVTNVKSGPTKEAELGPTSTAEGTATTRRLVVEPFQPEGGAGENVVALAKLAKDWKKSTEPGRRTWHVGVSGCRPVIVPVVWCAINSRTLEQNYEHLTWTLEVDGKRVDLNTLFPYESDGIDRACRGYTGIVREWPSGRHIIRETITIDEIIHDGWDPYPAGEYVDEFVIDVYPKPQEVVIEPYEPESGRGEGIATLKTLVRGWKASTEPGRRTWHVEIPSCEPVRVWMAWCATNSRTLEQNYEHLTWTLEVDGKRVDLNTLFPYESDGIDRACRGYTGIVREWPSGRHIIRETITIDEIIHDGWAPYPAGEYVDEFVVIAH